VGDINKVMIVVVNIMAGAGIITTFEATINGSCAHELSYEYYCTPAEVREIP
jgi:hypothetical protein